MALLEVNDLRTEFRTESGTVRAVDGLSFSVEEGEVFAIVGESGCGKTATALSILGLLPEGAGRVVGGTVRFKGEDLLAVRARRLRELRGEGIAMVFQEPSLDPVMRVGDQIAEVIRAHRTVSRHEARARSVELLDLVRIPRPDARARDYPHQFSGGMRQRATIAMAIALEPDLLIADEPTTALDVTIQAQILDLLREIRARLGMALMLITHDLGVVAGFADRVMVMYAGRMVEEAPVRELFRRPAHPYTWGLLESTTRIDRPRRDRLVQVLGLPPNLIDPPPGCRFAPRCDRVEERCRTKTPEERVVADGHRVACLRADEVAWLTS
jgi:oligopeptide/dipeptide ABC transporter ATP-binding protein